MTKNYICPKCNKELNKVIIDISCSNFYQGSVKIRHLLKSANTDTDTERFFIEQGLVESDGEQIDEINAFCPLCKNEVDCVADIIDKVDKIEEDNND